MRFGSLQLQATCSVLRPCAPHLRQLLARRCRLLLLLARGAHPLSHLGAGDAGFKLGDAAAALRPSIGAEGCALVLRAAPAPTWWDSSPWAALSVGSRMRWMGLAGEKDSCRQGVGGRRGGRVQQQARRTEARRRRCSPPSPASHTCSCTFTKQLSSCSVLMAGGRGRMVTVTLSPSAAGVRARRTVPAAAAAVAQVPAPAQQQRRGGCAGLSGAGCFAAQAEKRAPIRASSCAGLLGGGCAPRLGAAGLDESRRLWSR